MTFRNLDLGTRCAHCYWDITASRLSGDWGNRYTHICTLYIHKHLYLFLYLFRQSLALLLFVSLAYRFCIFYKIKFYGTHIKQVYWHHFSGGICSIIISVSHFDNSCDISLLLWWPMISVLCYYCKKFWLTEDSGWWFSIFLAIRYLKIHWLFL